MVEQISDICSHTSNWNWTIHKSSNSFVPAEMFVLPWWSMWHWRAFHNLLQYLWKHCILNFWLWLMNKNYALCYVPLLWRLQNVCQNSWELWLKSGKKLIWAWIWTIYNCILNIKLNLKLSHHTDCCQGIFTILSLYGSSTMATLYWCHYVRGGEEIKKGREK